MFLDGCFEEDEPNPSQITVPQADVQRLCCREPRIRSFAFLARFIVGFTLSRKSKPQ